MADIITKDSEEFKELTGWIKRTGKNLEAAAARIRPTIADEHYLSEMRYAGCFMFPSVHYKHYGMKRQYLIPQLPLSGVNCSIRKAGYTRY